MRWEIIDKSPKVGDVRFKTRFAWLPTKVLSKITMTDHWIWLELYLEEQEWKGPGIYSPAGWRTIAKTIHV